MKKSRNVTPDDIDLDLVSRSLTRSSSVDAARVLSFERLQFLARRSRKALRTLMFILEQSVEFIRYRQRMAKAIAGEGHGIGCVCDLCALERRCASFRMVIWRGINLLRSLIKRPNLSRGVSVDVFAKKIVLTGYAWA
jgi:hypothetical protein